MMRHGHWRILAACPTAVLAAVIVSSGLGASAEPTGRRPPQVAGDFCSISFKGVFLGANWSYVEICPAREKLIACSGMAPGTCRAEAGRISKPNRDGAISAQFNLLPRAAVAVDGSFAFTVRSPGPGQPPANPSLPKIVMTVRGTFYGNNVVGRVRFTSGKDAFYTGCTGDVRFRAKRSDLT